MRSPWVNNKSLIVTHLCIVPLVFEKYKICVSCDILPMDITEYLVRLTVDEFSGEYFDADNVYSFDFLERREYTCFHTN